MNILVIAIVLLTIGVFGYAVLKFNDEQHPGDFPEVTQSLQQLDAAMNGTSDGWHIRDYVNAEDPRAINPLKEISTTDSRGANYIITAYSLKSGEQVVDIAKFTGDDNPANPYNLYIRLQDGKCISPPIETQCFNLTEVGWKQLYDKARALHAQIRPI